MSVVYNKSHKAPQHITTIKTYENSMSLMRCSGGSRGGSGGSSEPPLETDLFHFMRGGGVKKNYAKSTKRTPPF